MAELLTIIGYRGTGKSTVARLVAARLGWNWIDADDEIEQAAGCSIARLFAEAGEAEFRDLEVATMRELTGRNRCVIASGGGAVLRAENRESMQAGKIAWLTATPETILQRIQNDENTAERRPSLTDLGELEEIVRLLAVRTPMYKHLAQITVATDDVAPDIVAARLANWIRHPDN